MWQNETKFWVRHFCRILNIVLCTRILILILEDQNLRQNFECVSYCSMVTLVPLWRTIEWWKGGVRRSLRRTPVIYAILKPSDQGNCLVWRTQHKEEWLLLNLAFVRGKKPLLKLSKQLIKSNASVASYDFSFLKEVRKRHLTCNFVIGVIKVCNNAVFCNHILYLP